MATGRVTDFSQLNGGHGLRWDALRAHVREALLEVSRQVATGDVDLAAAQAVARVWQAVDRLMDQLEQCPDGNKATEVATLD